MKEQLERLVTEMYLGGILYSEAVREFKKRFIENVLRQNNGNQCKAARELGMHRNTLSRTIAELSLDVRQFRAGGRRPIRKEAVGRESTHALQPLADSLSKMEPRRVGSVLARGNKAGA